MSSQGRLVLYDLLNRYYRNRVCIVEDGYYNLIKDGYTYIHKYKCESLTLFENEICLEMHISDHRFQIKCSRFRGESSLNLSI